MGSSLCQRHLVPQGVHSGPWSNGACQSCAASVCCSFTMTQVICLPCPSIGLNPALTSIKNGQCHQIMASIYIQIIVTEFKQIISHTVQGDVWSAYVSSIWACHKGPTVAPDHLPPHLPWPSPNYVLGPNNHTCSLPSSLPMLSLYIVCRYRGSFNCLSIDLQSYLVTDAASW